MDCRSPLCHCWKPDTPAQRHRTAIYTTPPTRHDRDLVGTSVARARYRKTHGNNTCESGTINTPRACGEHVCSNTANICCRNHVLDFGEPRSGYCVQCNELHFLMSWYCTILAAEMSTFSFNYNACTLADHIAVSSNTKCGSCHLRPSSLQFYAVRVRTSPKQHAYINPHVHLDGCRFAGKNSPNHIRDRGSRTHVGNGIPNTNPKIARDRHLHQAHAAWTSRTEANNSFLYAQC